MRRYQDRDFRRRRSDFYRQVTPPDQLSSFSNGSDISRTDESAPEMSSLPTGDTARNIGRPSPDSPNLKYRNLDRGESVGRKPAERADLGYVHDSGSGSARVIPYDSGFANNSSALRKARSMNRIAELERRIEELERLGGGDEKDGSYMSLQNLRAIRDMTDFLLEEVEHGDELDDWVEDKISHAHGALMDVARFIGYGKGSA